MMAPPLAGTNGTEAAAVALLGNYMAGSFVMRLTATRLRLTKDLQAGNHELSLTAARWMTSASVLARGDHDRPSPDYPIRIATDRRLDKTSLYANSRVAMTKLAGDCGARRPG
jgi:hypothetical protein